MNPGGEKSWPFLTTVTCNGEKQSCPGPARFIPTHRGQGLLASEIASLPTRSGSMKNPTYIPLRPESFTDFDWLAVLDSTGYSRGGPALGQLDGGERE
ncbi:MAG: hypothetical protein PHF80_03895 [Methanothrix sp.]|nr:hypothetical protein [Methanothrix sp.]